MKKVFQQIIDICERNKDEEGTLDEIKLKAKNRVIRYEWLEKYGIVLDPFCRLAETDYYNIGSYQAISFFKDGYKARQDSSGRCISWAEGDKQPVNEWIYSIGFSTGAYIFGEDYEGQKQLFQDFFEELRAYKPDYEDLHNHCLYWKIENAKEIMSQFSTIVNKYHDKNKSELRTREITALEKKLANLKAQDKK